MSTTVQDILIEESKCPMCGAHNLPWNEMQKLGELTNTVFPSIDVRGATYTVEGFYAKVAHGTACWDSNFGDECGSCLRTIINTETSLVSPGGMGH